MDSAQGGSRSDIPDRVPISLAAHRRPHPNGGAGWLDDGAPDTLSRHYHPWHFVASALRGVVSYGPTLTVGLHGIDPYDEPGLAIGDHVRVNYRTLHRALVASSVTPG